jgi:hypothetical protein
MVFVDKARRDETKLLSLYLGSGSQLRGLRATCILPVSPETSGVALHSGHGYVRFPAAPWSSLDRSVRVTGSWMPGWDA